MKFFGFGNAAFFVVSDAVGDLGEVADAFGREDDLGFGCAPLGFARVPVSALGVDQFHEMQEEGIDARVAEVTGDTGEDGHLFGRAVKGAAVALDLFGDVAVGIVGSAFIGFVDGDHIGKVEHIDFFKLRGCAIFGGHDIHGEVAEVDDGAIALADASGFEDDQVEAGGLECMECVTDGGRDGGIGLSCGHRAHKDARGRDGIHADAVAEECAASASAGGVDGEDGEVAVGIGFEHPSDQFVGERGLSSAASAGDAEDGGFVG